jgi:hypothetical protein
MRAKDIRTYRGDSAAGSGARDRLKALAAAA